MKNRIILIAIGVILIATLYTLPRVMVENDDVQEVEVGSSVDIKPDLPENKASLSEEAREKVEALSRKLKQEDNSENFRNFADSLADIYLEAEYYDSASKYLSLKFTKSDEQADLEEMGTTYYEAFRKSEDKDKAQRLAASAREYLGRAISQDSQRYDLRVKYAMTLVSGSNPMQGILMLRQIADESPSNGEAQYNLGILSVQTNQWDKAIDWFDKVINNNPDNFQARFFQALAYTQVGKKDSARYNYQYILDRAADEEMKQIAQGHLREL